jgi:hypothetical protein
MNAPLESADPETPVNSSPGFQRLQRKDGTGTGIGVALFIVVAIPRRGPDGTDVGWPFLPAR